MIKEMNGHALLHREMESPTEINRILNDPSVFSLISPPDYPPLDVTPLVTDPRYVFLVGQGGVIVFSPDSESGSGIYEVHINFTEDHRGKHAAWVVQEALRWIFTKTSCAIVQTQVPVFNRPAEVLAKSVGGRLWFERKKVWPTVEGAVDIRVYIMTIYDWLATKPKPVMETGRLFHVKLEEEYERHDFVHQSHPDDEAHDLAVGAAVEMIRGGEPEKGIVLYNRWARVAGYQQINLISKNPVLLDMGESMIHVTGDTFKVVKCRPAH
jgi:hypothetical protein